MMAPVSAAMLAQELVQVMAMAMVRGLAATMALG
jgi:hypothetical protein